MPKRNAQGAGSIRQRPDGRWEGRITVGRDPGTGKQLRRSVYADSQAEVVKAIQRLQTEREAGTYTEPSKMTVSAWLDIWLKDYTAHLKPRTKTLYEGHIRARIKPALGAVKLQQLKPHQIQAFYNSLQAGDKPMAPKTIQNLHALLHKALQQAVEVEYLRSNPTQGCKLPRVEKAQIHVLDDAQITRFLEAIAGHEYETLFTIALFTGMRQGELLGLTWDCFNFKKGTIYIYRQLQKDKGVYQFGPVKNDKPRTISPAGYIMDMMKSHKLVQTEWQLRAGPAWENKDGFVFTDELGQHIKRTTVIHRFQRVIKGLDLPISRFHDLRHSYAVASLRSGDDARTVQETLGHHSAAFTLDVYAHVTEQMKKESADRMDAFIKSVKGG